MQNLKNILFIGLLTAFTWAVSDDVLVSENVFSGMSRDIPTSSVRMLNFDMVDEPQPLYETALEDYYAPGETVTINLRITSENAVVRAVSVIFFGQKVTLQEFEDRLRRALGDVAREVSYAH